MTATGKRRRRPLDRVHHVESDVHPVDAAIDRRFPQRALRGRIGQATKRLEAVLGPRRVLWLKLEEPLNELHSTREDAYFDLGFEHGFAAGRSDARKGAPEVRDLGVRLRDLAIQHGVQREDALAAVLDAAQSLAVGGVPPTKVGRARK